LIALSEWGEPKYGVFYQSLGQYHATKYTISWHTSDPKKRKRNARIFSMLYDEMHEKLENTWIIPLEVVGENQGITNFQDSRHNMWI
jgi:hypothetical protein